MKLNRVAEAGIIFAAVLVLLLLLDGNRLLLGTNDEGIYLDAADRMLHGQKLYTDFFGYISPGVFWVQEAFFRVFGVTMLAGRLPVLLYFASQCALLYWLTARLVTRNVALFTLFLFFAIQSADLNFLTAQHRWDSSAAALAAIAFAVHGHFTNTRWPWFLSGALSVAAAFFTPSMLLVAGATVVWLFIVRDLRGFLVPYLAGGTILAVALLGITAATGILAPFIDQMRWLSRNYSTVNVMTYGATIGGYRNLLEGPFDVSLVARVLVVLCLALPAILPVTNLVGWVAALLLPTRLALKLPQRRSIVYLLFCSAALVGSTYPRPDVTHLAWVAAVFYALAAALFSIALPKWAQATALIVGMCGGGLMLLHLGMTVGGEGFTTPVGEVRAAQNSAGELSNLLAQVKPGDSTFVYPYKPLLYFLTQSKNPTRYSYLAPGMMNTLDEQSALADLRRSPPKWVLLLRLSPEEFLRVFPNADLSTLRFAAIESWIDANYSPADPPVDVAGYRLERYRGHP